MSGSQSYARRRRTSVAVVVGTIGVAVLGSGLPASATGAPPATAPAAAAPSAETAASYLWAVNGTTGSIVRTSGKRLTLRVEGLPSYVTQFADRPIRKAYAVSVRAFVDRWESLFGDSDPNAVLSYRTRGGDGTRSIVLTLRNPRLKNGALVFGATRIHRDVDPSPDDEARVDPPRIPTPARFRSPSLFIDNVADSSERFLAEVLFMPQGLVPKGDRAANGQRLSISGNTSLFAAIYDGAVEPGTTTFPLPDIPGTWPAMTATGGTSVAGGWVLNDDGGIWASTEVPDTLLPGQVYFTSAFRYDPTSRGGVQTTLGGAVPAGMRAFEFPEVTFQERGTQYVSEMRMLRTDAPLPDGWLEANGAVLQTDRYEVLWVLLGTTFGGDGKTTFALPKATAPQGYRWVIAYQGYFPSVA